MDFIYEDGNIKISNENNLILGASVSYKRIIKEKLEQKVKMVDRRFKFSTKTVSETLENYGISSISDSLKNKNISDLSLEEYYYLAIILLINLKPSVLIIDEVLAYLDDALKKEVISLAKKSDIKLLVFNNDLNYVYKDFNLIVLYQDKPAIIGKYNDVLKEDKILRRLGFEIPFYVDLSIQLKLYGKVDKICFTKKELEGELWK